MSQIQPLKHLWDTLVYGAALQDYTSVGDMRYRSRLKQEATVGASF
ncbi:hypothetical protein IQ272_07750 [Chroococcidiopsidales cyanobacterium LEGE 13417]|nr:hypothetical protein [Chroococcidiopsidales cyanobacterium LEGE 13417]